MAVPSLSSTLAANHHRNSRVAVVRNRPPAWTHMPATISPLRPHRSCGRGSGIDSNRSMRFDTGGTHLGHSARSIFNAFVEKLKTGEAANSRHCEIQQHQIDLRVGREFELQLLEIAALQDLRAFDRVRDDLPQRASEQRVVVCDENSRGRMIRETCPLKAPTQGGALTRI